jgi:hypothetical protein
LNQGDGKFVGHFFSGHSINFVIPSEARDL